MSDKLEVGYLCSVLDQSPHVLPVRFINVIVHCFQIQAVHLQRVGNLQTDAEVNCWAETRQGEEVTSWNTGRSLLCEGRQLKYHWWGKSLKILSSLRGRTFGTVFNEIRIRHFACVWSFIAVLKDRLKPHSSIHPKAWQEVQKYACTCFTHNLIKPEVTSGDTGYS